MVMMEFSPSNEEQGINDIAHTAGNPNGKKKEDKDSKILLPRYC